MSVGREFVRENVEGKIIPILKVNWISGEYRTLDFRPGPYVISFSDAREAEIPVVNESGKKKISFSE